MEQLFGASWRTTLFGIIQLIAGTAVNYIQSLGQDASFNWSVFSMQVLLAVLSFLAKDNKVHGGTVDSGVRPQ